MGSRHVLTDGILLNSKFYFMKSAKLVSNSVEKGILNDAINSSDNEQLDLYKAIFGGTGSDCPVVAISQLSSRVSAYDKTDQQFLRI
ncbi:MAG: hypothetical protein JWR05_428 [Mucilaginibacter sp.]|nr:hypothetical protein [Mucilaginibacter sp.]